MKNVVFVIVVMALLGCEASREYTLDESSVEMELKDELRIELDATTVQNSKNFHSFGDGIDQYLGFFNQPDNSIKIYSLSNKTQVESIQLRYEGPHKIIGLSGSPNSFSIKSLDSVYVYSPVQERIFHVNRQAEILNSWPVRSSRHDLKIPVFDINTLCHFFDNNDYFLMTGRVSWYDDGNPPIAIIPKNGVSVQEQMPSDFPIYENLKLDEVGNANFFKASNTQMSDGSILVSFPLDHRITKIHKDKTVEYINLVNPLLGKLRPFGKKANNQTLSSEAYFDYQGTAPIYHAILADNYRNLVYRIGRLEFPRNELEKIKAGGERKSWDFSIMIYDTDFNYLGETRVENSIEYDFQSLFVSPQGLNIRRISMEEDYLIFDVFELQGL